MTHQACKACSSILKLREKADQHRKTIADSQPTVENELTSAFNQHQAVIPKEDFPRKRNKTKKCQDFLASNMVRGSEALNTVDRRVFNWYEPRRNSSAVDTERARDLENRPVSVSRMSRDGRVVEKCTLQSFEEINAERDLLGMLVEAKFFNLLLYQSMFLKLMGDLRLNA